MTKGGGKRAHRRLSLIPASKLKELPTKNKVTLGLPLSTPVRRMTSSQWISFNVVELIIIN